MRRVVITGMSEICAAGSEHNEVFRNLCEKKIDLHEIEKNNPAREKICSRFYIPYPEFDDSKYKDKLRQVKRRGAKSAYTACASALMALDDASIEVPDDDTRVYMGIGAPNMYELMEQTFKLEETQKVDLLLIPMTMQSSLAAWISIVLGIHGRSSVLSMACASGTEAVGSGYESILNGQCDMALCGGSDYLPDKNLLLLHGFEALKCATLSEEGYALPFCEESSGFLFSEWAASVLVLEELEHARARGAKIYAEITGFESSCDGYSIVSMPEDGSIITKMMKRLVGDKKVDYYNAHGTATKLNDAAEAAMIHNVFGSKETQPAISSTKCLIGHTLGASGAIEVAVCAESIQHNKVHGNTCKTVYDDLNFTAETRDVKVDTAVSASFGFGGHNAAIMLERYK